MYITFTLEKLINKSKLFGQVLNRQFLFQGDIKRRITYIVLPNKLIK